MQKINRIVPIVLMLLFAASVLLPNQAQAQGKIGVLDMNKVLTTSNAGKRAQNVIEQKMASYKKSFEKEGKALMEMREELEKKGQNMSESARKTKIEAFQKKGRELAEKENSANAEMQKLREQHIQPIVKKLEQVVEKIADKEGYTIILPRNIVLYQKNSIDITDKVIAELNKSLK